MRRKADDGIVERLSQPMRAALLGTVRPKGTTINALEAIGLVRFTEDNGWKLTRAGTRVRRELKNIADTYGQSSAVTHISVRDFATSEI